MRTVADPGGGGGGGGGGQVRANFKVGSIYSSVSHFLKDCFKIRLR